MGAPKPCLGYPSRTAAAVALRAEGLDYRQIADRIGITPNSAAGLLSVYDNNPRRFQLTIALPEDHMPGFVRHSYERTISVKCLVERLLEVIHDDNLIDALLDDADELARVAALRASAPPRDPESIEVADA